MEIFMTLSDMLEAYNLKAIELNIPARDKPFRNKEQAVKALAEVGITYAEDPSAATEVAAEPKKKAKKMRKAKKAKAKKKGDGKTIDAAFRGQREIIMKKLVAAKGKFIPFSVLTKAIDGSSGAVSLAIRGMELRLKHVMPGYKLIKERKGKEMQVALQTSKQSTV
jgi:hypothetical protein